MERLERLGFLFAGVRQYLNISYEKIQELSPKINIESVKAWEQGDNKQILFWEIQELLDLVGLDIELGFNLDKPENEIGESKTIYETWIFPRLKNNPESIEFIFPYRNQDMGKLIEYINANTNYDLQVFELASGDHGYAYPNNELFRKLKLVKKS